MIYRTKRGIVRCSFVTISGTFFVAFYPGVAARSDGGTFPDHRTVRTYSGISVGVCICAPGAAPGRGGEARERFSYTPNETPLILTVAGLSTRTKQTTAVVSGTPLRSVFFFYYYTTIRLRQSRFGVIIVIIIILSPSLVRRVVPTPSPPLYRAIIKCCSRI